MFGRLGLSLPLQEVDDPNAIRPAPSCTIHVDLVPVQRGVPNSTSTAVVSRKEICLQATKSALPGCYTSSNQILAESRAFGAQGQVRNIPGSYNRRSAMRCDLDRPKFLMYLKASVVGPLHSVHRPRSNVILGRPQLGAEGQMYCNIGAGTGQKNVRPTLHSQLHSLFHGICPTKDTKAREHKGAGNMMSPREVRYTILLRQSAISPRSAHPRQPDAGLTSNWVGLEAVL